MKHLLCYLRQVSWLMLPDGLSHVGEFRLVAYSVPATSCFTSDFSETRIKPNCFKLGFVVDCCRFTGRKIWMHNKRTIKMTIDYPFILVGIAASSDWLSHSTIVLHSRRYLPRLVCHNFGYYGRFAARFDSKHWQRVKIPINNHRKNTGYLLQLFYCQC